MPDSADRVAPAITWGELALLVEQALDTIHDNGDVDNALEDPAYPLKKHNRAIAALIKYRDALDALSWVQPHGGPQHMTEMKHDG